MFLPIIYVYHSGGTFNERGGLDAMFAKFSLGNIGQAGSYCAFKYLSMKNVATL